jgi:hypothetical protein
MEVLCSRWHSIDMDCPLLLVKFESRLSIPVLRSMAAFYRKLELKTDEFFKKFTNFSYFA